MPPKKSNAKKPVAKAQKKRNQQSKPRNGFGPVRSAPMVSSTLTLTGQPQVRRGKNTVIIRHKEMITGLLGAAAYTNSYIYPLNPGMAVTFPWLSTQAAGWERYVFRKLRFAILTRAPTTIAGTVILSPDYDAADGSPANEAAACSYEDTVSGPVWSNLICELNPESMRGGTTSKFIRVGDIGTNLDIKTYDAGNIFVGVSDTPALYPYGKLWVEYEVELITPHTLPPSSNSSASYVATGMPTPFGTLTAKAGPFIGTPANSTIHLQNLTPGVQYLLRTWGEIASGNLTSTVFSSLANMAEVAATVANASNAGVNLKMVMNESVMLPHQSNASCAVTFGGANTGMRTAIEVIPITQPSTAWNI